MRSRKMIIRLSAKKGSQKALMRIPARNIFTVFLFFIFFIKNRNTIKKAERWMPEGEKKKLRLRALKSLVKLGESPIFWPVIMAQARLAF